MTDTLEEKQKMVYLAMKKLPRVAGQAHFDATWHGLYGLICGMSYLEGRTTKDAFASEIEFALANVKRYVEEDASAAVLGPAERLEAMST